MYRQEKVMELTLIIQLHPRLMKKVMKLQRTLTKANGKTTLSMELANNLTLELVPTTVIGKTERGTEKVLWYTKLKTSILDNGKEERKTVKELIFSNKLAWNTLVHGRLDKWLRVNGFIQMELALKAISTIINQKDTESGIL